MVLELYSSSKDIIVKFNFCSELGNYNRNFLLVDDVEVIVCLKIDIESQEMKIIVNNFLLNVSIESKFERYLLCVIDSDDKFFLVLCEFLYFIELLVKRMDNQDGFFGFLIVIVKEGDNSCVFCVCNE